MHRIREHILVIIHRWKFAKASAQMEQRWNGQGIHAQKCVQVPPLWYGQNYSVKTLIVVTRNQAHCVVCVIPSHAARQDREPPMLHATAQSALGRPAEVA